MGLISGLLQTLQESKLPSGEMDFRVFSNFRTVGQWEHRSDPQDTVMLVYDVLDVSTQLLIFYFEHIDTKSLNASTVIYVILYSTFKPYFQMNTGAATHALGVGRHPKSYLLRQWFVFSSVYSCKRTTHLVSLVTCPWSRTVQCSP